MSEVGKRASLLGLASDALQEMHYAAKKSSVAIDTLDDSLKELQIRAVDSLSGSGEAFEAFDKLKVNPKNIFGRIREPLEILDEVADKLNKLPTQSERIWVVDSMFGDQGAEMLKMLKGGAAGLAKMRVEARALGGVLRPEAIMRATRFNEELKRMKTAFDAVVHALLDGIMPSLSAAMDNWAKFSIKMQESGVAAQILRLGVIALGEALVFLAAKAGLALYAVNPFKVAVGLGVVALTFAVEHLWSVFNGGHSVFKSLHQSARAFFGPIEQWLLDMPRKLLAALCDLAQKIPGLIAGMLPDFLKDDFSGNIKNASSVYHHMTPIPLNSRMAPQPATWGPNRLTSN